MPRWLWFALIRIRARAESRSLRFTHKARTEMAWLGLDETDGAAILMGLTVADFEARLRSRRTGEWLYVFKPRISGSQLYVKLVLRDDCEVISFHEEPDPEADRETP